MEWLDMFIEWYENKFKKPPKDAVGGGYFSCRTWSKKDTEDQVR